MERFEYIILTDNQAEYDDIKKIAYWNISDEYFKQYKNSGDDIYLEFVNCEFVGTLSVPTNVPLSNTANVIMENVTFQNQKSTSNNKLLAIVPLALALDGSNYYLSSGGDTLNQMKLKLFDKFYRIGLKLDYGGENIDIDVGTYYSFILKVSYVNRNNN